MYNYEALCVIILIFAMEAKIIETRRFHFFLEPYALLLNLSVSLFLIMSPLFRIWAKLGLILICLSHCAYHIRAIRSNNKEYPPLTFKSPLNKGFLLFGISAVVSTLFSISPYHSQKIIFNRYVLYLLCFYAGYNFVRDKENVKFFELIFMLSGIILGFGGLFYYLQNFPARLYFAWNVNVDIGLFAILFLPFSFIYLMKEHNLKMTAIAFLGFCLMTICLALNYSRGGFLSVILGIFVTLIVAKSKKEFLFLFGFILIFLVFAGTLETERLFNLYTWQYRISYIGEGFKLFKSSPLIGKGLGSFELLNFVHPAVGRHAIHVENLFVEILAQSGLFGLFAFVYLFWLYFKQFKGGIEKLETYQLALISSIVAFLFNGLFGSVIIVGVTMSFIFWFLLGISISKSRLGAHNLQ